MISDVKPGETVLYMKHNAKRASRATLVCMTRYRGRRFARIDDGRRTFTIDRRDIVGKRAKREEYRSYLR